MLIYSSQSLNNKKSIKKKSSLVQGHYKTVTWSVGRALTQKAQSSGSNPQHSTPPAPSSGSGFSSFLFPNYMSTYRLHCPSERLQSANNKEHKRLTTTRNTSFLFQNQRQFHRKQQFELGFKTFFFFLKIWLDFKGYKLKRRGSLHFHGPSTMNFVMNF